LPEQVRFTETFQQIVLPLVVDSCTPKKVPEQRLKTVALHPHDFPVQKGLKTGVKNLTCAVP
jgi:hypothetical protein